MYNVKTCNVFDPFFDALFGDEKARANHGSLSMKTDVKEVGDDYVLEVELPGFDKKDISLKADDGYLTIEAKIDTSVKEGKEDKFLRRERFSGTASRTYYIGDVEEESIKASYKDGILFVSFPKENPKAKQAHAITID